MTKEGALRPKVKSDKKIFRVDLISRIGEVNDATITGNQNESITRLTKFVLTTA